MCTHKILKKAMSCKRKVGKEEEKKLDMKTFFFSFLLQLLQLLFHSTTARPVHFIQYLSSTTQCSLSLSLSHTHALSFFSSFISLVIKRNFFRPKKIAPKVFSCYLGDSVMIALFFDVVATDHSDQSFFYGAKSLCNNMSSFAFRADFLVQCGDCK